MNVVNNPLQMFDVVIFYLERMFNKHRNLKILNNFVCFIENNKLSLKTFDLNKSQAYLLQIIGNMHIQERKKQSKN